VNARSKQRRANKVFTDPAQLSSEEILGTLPMARARLARMVRVVANGVFRMKSFLQHDESGLFYRQNDEWVASPAEALAFNNEKEALQFRDEHNARPSHAVRRLDPSWLARVSVRAPGMYQAGE
jgi:hypothetical protein